MGVRFKVIRSIREGLMNKATRTALFIVVATIVNLLITVTIFLILMVLYGLTLARLLPPETGAIGTFVCFILSVVGAGFVYKKILNYGQKRYDLEKLIGPATRRKPARRD